jgi:hypothetical protein
MLFVAALYQPHNALGLTRLGKNKLDWFLREIYWQLNPFTLHILAGGTLS